MKNDLRRQFKAKRANIAHKAEKDRLICAHFLSSALYKNTEQILCYSSMGSEPDTFDIIRCAMEDGKKLLLPRCEDKNGNMNFYLIKDASDLVTGTFGIKEPDIKKCEPVFEFTNALCVVPGLTFDKKGYRLGYGKGYYDRFLEKFTIKSAGLCYNELISESIPADEYDRPVNYIVTDLKIINT